MGLFEQGYKAAAKTELERALREIEEKDKAAQTIGEMREEAAALGSNLDFSQRLGLISATQANLMRQRLKAAIKYEKQMRSESQERVDDFENPRERSKRYFNMDSINSEIANARARDVTKEADATKSTGIAVEDPLLERR